MARGAPCVSDGEASPPLGKCSHLFPWVRGGPGRAAGLSSPHLASLSISGLGALSPPVSWAGQVVVLSVSLSVCLSVCLPRVSSPTGTCGEYFSYYQ